MTNTTNIWYYKWVNIENLTREELIDALVEISSSYNESLRKEFDSL